MSKTCLVPPRSLISIATIAVVFWCVPRTYGNDAVGVIAPAPTARTTVGNEGIASLGREIHQMTGLLQAQQEQMDRQAAQLEQLQAELDRRRALGWPAEEPPVPPAAYGTPAMPVSDAAGMVQPGHTCAGCAPCDHCRRDDCNGNCTWFEVGGQYRLMHNASNFDHHASTISDSQESQNFFNQRFRTWLEIHTSELVSGYLQVEMGHIFWGDAPEFPKTYPGPFSPAGDRVGIELRRGYLTYGNQEVGMFRAGIQDWHDAFGESYTLGTFGAVDDYDSAGAVLANSVWDFNVGGLAYAGPAPLLRGLNLNAGIFVVWEGEKHDADDAFLLVFDLDRPVSDDSSVGFSAYYLSDRGTYSYPITVLGVPFAYDSAWDLWIGVRANTVLWGIPTRGFAIYNRGQREEFGGLPTFEHNDVALKLELGPVCFGRGKLRFQTLYSTGDGNSDETRRDGFRTIAQSERDNFGSQGYWSYLVLTSPHGPSDVNDLGVGLQNRGLGLFTVQAKYDYPICGRLSGAIAVGWLQSDARNPASGSKDMGTELANMYTFDFGGGLTLDFGAAVFFTGNFYKETAASARPDDLWEVFTRAQLEF